MLGCTRPQVCVCVCVCVCVHVRSVRVFMSLPPLEWMNGELSTLHAFSSRGKNGEAMRGWMRPDLLPDLLLLSSPEPLQPRTPARPRS